MQYVGVEQCDDGNADQGDACLNNCQTARCGDGQLQIEVEECDDGNLQDGDDCDRNCQSEGLDLPDNCYELDGRNRASFYCRDARGWDTARARCNLALNGSDLMSLETSDELAAIRQQLSESGHLTTDFWVGLVDNNGVNFAPGPAWLNDWGGPLFYSANEAGRRCFRIRRSDERNLHDKRCGERYHYLCEQVR
ncbi:MAG: hypothetical protein CMH58_00835 [Myxococcales bacterium]|nr:hypothetical protein [Myxococcales bacterium]